MRLYGVQRLDAYISERPCHVQRNASVELRHRLLARQDHKLPESHDAVGLARTHGKTAEDSRMYVRSAKPKGALLSCVGGSSLDRRAGARSVVHAGVGGGRPAGTRTVRDPRRATWFHVWGYYIIASRGEGPAIYIVSSGGEGPACYMKRPCQRTQLREWY